MKENLDDIIKFENENTVLDFKAIQYHKAKFQDLLKDLISMANAKTDDDKYIIVGVKLLGNGNRNIEGITDDFIDEATYQQLIYNNIEPELNFSYFSYQFEKQIIGVFKIFDSNDRPYMMKKDFGKLAIGNAFIRKGSHQTRLTRKDLDFYTEEKITKNRFNGKIFIYFDKINRKSIEFKISSNRDLPSDKVAEEIKKIILDKKDKLKKNKGILMPFSDLDISMIGERPYENRSIKTLEENLAENYREDDIYYLFEVLAHKFNFSILNDDTKYLEDASIELKIDKEGIYIADKIFHKPDNSGCKSHLNYTSNTLPLKNRNYPEVIENETEYLIFEQIGNLKHQISENAFKVDLRIVIDPKILNSEKLVKIKIFGKNLSKPIEDKLIIKIVD